MSADNAATFELEIAHVLFVDIVGYSSLLIDKQRESLDELNRVVRDTHSFRAAESAGKLIRLPTGDGMALIFSDSPEKPAECALEISRALKASSRVPLRMGIHSGPVSRVVDVNDRSNAAGAGINIAQRVMSCGDAGHILLSQHAADDLIEYARWRPFLHEIGECEVKHGAKVALVNLYSDEVGNPELPALCRKREQSGQIARRFSFSGWPRVALMGAASAVVAGLLYAVYVTFSAKPARLPVSQDIIPPEKSIAVLPFENLSDDKQNAFFADGMQDEILVDLGKVAELKVISRTSVMAFRDRAERNLRAIGRMLGVAYVLEGTVRRDKGRIRVTAQLINAMTDSHVWAESYDRDLSDLFALESELAEKIVSQLKAQLSPQVKAAIQERPTSDLAAYDLYTRAKTRLTSAAMMSRKKENYLEAVRLFDQAVSRDREFVMAYYELARAHDEIYLVGIDHSPARLRLAEQALQEILRLRPNSGEAHVARAFHLYAAYFDYDQAKQELAVAHELLPNLAWVFELGGYIDRRRGRWEESLNQFRRAIELDPQNVDTLQQVALSYGDIRQFDKQAEMFDRALAVTPGDDLLRVQRALVDLEWHADAKPLHATIRAIVDVDASKASDFADIWFYLALCQRDPAQADRVLGHITENFRDDAITFPSAWPQALAHQLHGDEISAKRAWTQARLEVEKSMGEQPDFAAPLCVLGLIDAMLGRKEDAVREGRRAAELLPVSKDAINGTLMIQYLAIIYAWVGDKDRAIEQLEIAARLPGSVSYGQLRLHPLWDPLRGDPRFEKIVTSLAPSTAPP